jgi:type II secretory pathway pseudopilin PulG
MRRHTGYRRHNEGFTLIEAVIGIVLVAIAVLGLAQVFTLSITNNLRAERISNASFLAQQQMDLLRDLTQEEISFLFTNQNVDLNGDGNADIVLDERIDLNRDGLDDYRRVTDILAGQTEGTSSLWQVTVMVFSQEQFSYSRSDLLQDPQGHRLRGRMDTVITR